MTPVDQVRDHLRTALREAMRTGDHDARSALRGAMAALDGAEAVPADGHAASIGTLADAARATLTAADVRRVLAAEVAEHQHAVTVYRELGDDATAEAMRARADTVARFVPPEHGA